MARMPSWRDDCHVSAPLARVVRQCGERDVRLWFHRAFGAGSVSGDAVLECIARGIRCIVGGCRLMYCEPMDLPHWCMRWLLRFCGKVPG